jgi:TolA-binding protein
MRRLSWIAVALALAALTQGCVRYYRVKDVRQSMSRGLAKLSDAVKRAEADLAHKRRIAARHDAGSARAEQQLDTMAGAIHKLRELRVELLELKTGFEKLAHGRRVIRSDSPEWHAVQEIRAQSEALTEQVESAAGTYEEASQELERVVRERAG